MPSREYAVDGDEGFIGLNSRDNPVGPVDLVTGEHDPKFTELARRIGERLPKARLSVIEGCGHAVHLERPADLVQVLR
jgi:pimeloyl-ACP methyl ester carboxylesterase